MKVANWDIVSIEVPGEISLALNISGCPHLCKGCHSEHLRKDIGTELTTDLIDELIKANKGITCVVFMGGDRYPDIINNLCGYIKSKNLKTAWYSGSTEISKLVSLSNLNYIKIGPYIEDLGGLDKASTNQRMYKIADNLELIDITYKFRLN